MQLPKFPSVAEVRKTLLAAAGLLALIIESGTLHGVALHYAQVASGVIASVLVYVVKNAPANVSAPVVPAEVPPPPTATAV